jgi:hypothetical protein
VWAGVDKAWEQKKLGAPLREILENAADFHTSGASMNIARDHFIQEDDLRPENALLGVFDGGYYYSLLTRMP